MTARPPERLYIDRFDTPVGVALLATDEDGYLRAFDWSDYEDRQVRLSERYNGRVPVETGAAPAATREALTAYFDGELHAIETIPWRTCGTDFQLSCWRAARTSFRISWHSSPLSSAKLMPLESSVSSTCKAHPDRISQIRICHFFAEQPRRVCPNNVARIVRTWRPWPIRFES